VGRDYLAVQLAADIGPHLLTGPHRRNRKRRDEGIIRERQARPDPEHILLGNPTLKTGPVFSPIFRF
jgi:hypothetical protein